MKGKIFAKIGKTTKKPKFSVKGLKGKRIIDTSINNLQKSWKKTLSSEV